MNYQDRSLNCRDCSVDFVFSSSEQEFFAAKGLTNEPRRCPDCRLVMQASRKGVNPQLHAVTCDECGADCKVSFRPTGRKPVFCMPCLHKSRTLETAEAVS